MNRRSEHVFFKKLRNENCEEIYEKCWKSLVVRKRQVKLWWDVSSHISEWLLWKQQRYMLMRVGKIGLLYSVEYVIIQLLWKNTRNRFTGRIWKFQFWVITQKVWDWVVNDISAFLFWLWHYTQWLSYRIYLSSHQQINRYKLWSINTMS